MLKRLFFVAVVLFTAVPFQVDCLAQRLVHFGTPPPLQYPVWDDGKFYKPGDPGYDAVQTRAAEKARLQAKQNDDWWQEQFRRILDGPSASQQRYATEKFQRQLAENQSAQTTILITIAATGVCAIIVVAGLLVVLLKRTRGGAKG